MIDAWILKNSENLQFALFFSLLFIFGLAEFLAPRRSGPMQRRTRWLTNFALAALNVVIMGLLPVTFFGSAVWAAGRGYGLFNRIGMPLALAVVANLLGRGFISFSTHYLMHKVPVLWRVHRVHHLDTELDVSTTVRFHPVEFVVNLILGVPVVVALGLSPWVLMLYEIIDAGVTVFSHANVRLPQALDRALRYIVVTPDLHRIHHSAWQTETDSNFSAVFPVWDVVFGTFRAHTRAPHETMMLGLEEVRDRRAVRANPPTYFLAALLLTAAVGALAPGPRWPAGPWRYLGLLPLAAGVALNVVSARSFERHGTPIRPGSTSSSLVIDGPYRVTRNPMYLGMALILLGTGLMLGSVVSLTVVPVFLRLLTRGFIVREERMLSARFGADYDAYRRRVRRFI